MKSRFASLALIYVKSTFSISFPTRQELRKPKTMLKTLGIALLAVLLVADFSFIFVMMDLSLYEGLKPARMQSLMLLNAATTSTILVFVFAFLMALSMFSMSNIEASFLVMPFSASELLAAKMLLVYVSEALLGAFVLLISMIIYGIKESPPFMFYVNGLITAFALPLIPTAIAYAILIPLMNASKVFRNKNFILYVGGFIGLGFALAFNFYIQSSMMKASDPAGLALMTGPDSFISKFGQAWILSWLAWKALKDASSVSGILAVLGNLAIGSAGCAAVILLFGKAYVKSLQDFNESTFSRKKLSGRAYAGVFVKKPAIVSLTLREFRLMNREPTYFLNGPFVIILMPIVIAIAFTAQKDSFASLAKELGPLLDGPAAYLIPAGFGAFLGSSTSIACTAVSRDAKAIPWMKALPVKPMQYFAAKFLHAEVFSVFGALLGSAAGSLMLSIGVGDALLSTLLALLFSSCMNMAGLWLDTAKPRLAWDNPTAALKQNPNAVIMILGTMGLIGGMAFLCTRISLPRYGYVMAFGVFFLVVGIACIVFYPPFAVRQYERLEA